MASVQSEIDAAILDLRWEFRLLAEEGSLPRGQVIDILLDYRDHDQVIADYMLYRLPPDTRVYITWDEIDSALSALEEE